MPKLNKETAKAVGKAEGSFAVVPDGVYTAKLLKCSVSDKAGASGAHYWKWEFVLDGNDKYDGSHQFLNTSLSDGALWKMNEVFSAYGVKPDTDTDELIGKSVRLKLSSRTIQGGARQGEQGNQIDKVLPLEGGNGEADGDDEIPF